MLFRGSSTARTTSVPATSATDTQKVVHALDRLLVRKLTNSHRVGPSSQAVAGLAHIPPSQGPPSHVAPVRRQIGQTRVAPEAGQTSDDVKGTTQVSVLHRREHMRNLFKTSDGT
jgi:hypothetical protein